MVTNPAKVVSAPAPVGSNISPVPAQASASRSDADDSSDDNDDTWDDFDVSDGTGLTYNEGGEQGGSSGGIRQPTLALFPEAGSTELQTFASANDALDHATSLGCDLVAVVDRLSLDAISVIRLLNYLRRNPGTLTPAQVTTLNGSEPFLANDEELNPVEGSENDGLLQIDFDDLIEERQQSGQDTAGDIQLRNRVAELEQQLQAIQMSYSDLQKRSLELLGLKSEAGKVLTDPVTPPKRDDDTTYFDSYAGNDIHQTMLGDTVRTLSYAKFILAPENSHIFRGARVMDIGAGSGILSMLAARAGASQVIAVDASNIALRAEKNIRENGLNHIISVVRGKIEDLDQELKPYQGKIDVIISEWMGYFLLYECMLPSVLHARDLYLRKGPNPQRPLAPATGLLAPSHNRMTIAAISDAELLHDRIKFWNDVYGFKMSAMTEGLYDEAYVETLSPHSIASDVVNIYDLPLGVLPVKQPVFRSPFRLTLQKDGIVHGFTSWFDTWFMSAHAPYVTNNQGDVVQLEGGQVLALPACTTKPVEPSDVPGIELSGNKITTAPSDEKIEADAKAGGLPVSFTTGPYGKPTHWKQTVFLLKEPTEAKKGDVIAGDIIVTQSEANTRELDVELHYLVEPAAPSMKAGKHVQTRMVSLFKVR